MEQTRKILVSGIKGYEGRKQRCQAQGRRLKRTALESMVDRSMKQLLGKSSWYKGRSKVDYYNYDKKPGSRKKGRRICLRG